MVEDKSSAPRTGSKRKQAAAKQGKAGRSGKARQLEEQALDAVFHALSDPSRRKIVELLREAGELRVTHLAEAFSMSLNGVSKHLKVLERAGLVTRRVDGRQHFIRVCWGALQPPYEWLHFYHHYWSRRLDALVDYVASEDPTKGKKP